jgi:hypothetical protein
MIPLLHTSRIAMIILGFGHSLRRCVSFAAISRSNAYKLVALFPAWAHQVTPQLLFGALPSSPLSFLFRSSNRKKSYGLISWLWDGCGACRNWQNWKQFSVAADRWDVARLKCTIGFGTVQRAPRRISESGSGIFCRNSRCWIFSGPELMN